MFWNYQGQKFQKTFKDIVGFPTSLLQESFPLLLCIVLRYFSLIFPPFLFGGVVLLAPPVPSPGKYGDEEKIRRLYTADFMRGLTPFPMMCNGNEQDISWVCLLNDQPLTIGI